MTETEARRAGHSIKIGRFDMGDSGKAYEIGEDRGLIKVVIDGDSNLILGAAVLAVDGAEQLLLFARARHPAKAGC